MHRVTLVLLLALTAVQGALDFTEVSVGDNKSFTQTKRCTAYHMLINYKRTMLHILPLFGSPTFMWTNVKFDECKETTFQSCPLSSVICGIATGEHAIDVSIGTCTDDLYVYVWDPETAGSDKKVDNVEFIPVYVDTPKACDSVEESDLALCGAMSEKQCDVCDGLCRLSICKEKKTERIQGILCLPANTTESEIADRCEAYPNNESGNWKRECDGTIRTGDVGALYAFISSVLILAYLCLCLSVFWYNFHMKRSGRAPVHCPRFCPNLLFPKAAEQQVVTVHAASYQPPEFYSEH